MLKPLGEHMELPEGTRVEVYKNLNKGCWSIRSASGETRGRVLAHADRVVLKDAKFVIQQAGKRRAIRERRRNVHAFVRGYITHKRPPGERRPVRYHPYDLDSFVCGEDEVRDARFVVFEHPRAWAIGPGVVIRP